MAPPVDLRLATPADMRLIAEFMLLAGGGLFEQLLEDIVPGIGAQPLLALALAINQTDGPFGCDNAVVADCGGRPAGMMLAFPAAEYRLPDAVTAFVPPARLHRIEALIGSCRNGSFYLHSLAVQPDHRRKGIARGLVRAAAALAAAQGFDTVSLHVWSGNGGAVHFYRALGFRTAGQVAMAPSPHLCWPGPVSLMLAETAMLLDRPAGDAVQSIRRAM
jgi:GNAT superfamily N-acetyltransferase